jgi:hypothetical protein
MKGKLTLANEGGEEAGVSYHHFIPRFAELALKCVGAEYPHKLDHAVSDASQVKAPRTLHPTFYGCYDWHSSVHAHWLLAHLMRANAGRRAAADGGSLLPEERMREALRVNLTAENLRAEDEYFKEPGRASFERPYGWAWLLKLHEELFIWDDPEAGGWFDAVTPLAETIVGKYLDFFPKQKYPIRAGTHFNTAFGLAFAHDYAVTLAAGGGTEAAGNISVGRLGELKVLVDERARTYYTSDASCPARWEPGGDDFLSPSLMEADLMRRVLGAEEFARWFDGFLPRLEVGEPGELLNPAEVTDRSDPKIVHLDGLNLSRAWCMRNVARALPADSPRAGVLWRSAARHAEAALPHVANGDYAGEHWLATFAVLMLGAPRPQEGGGGGA